ncbi:hypothetical protein AB0M46_00480 [Dactylosporangium sp. NPDC051485]|uniref:hypothetical protein n=1 Tax=Dactylosporangium sp. NPDC051485 TaxID=3154846 RepID=UPI0034308A02
MTMLNRMPDHDVVRRERLFEAHSFGKATDSYYSYGEAQLTRDGDLILYTKDSGYWVALMVGEMVALYHQWSIVSVADLPRLLGDGPPFENIRASLHIRPDEHSIDVRKRFHEWLTTAGVTTRFESYDEYN